MKFWWPSSSFLFTFVIFEASDVTEKQQNSLLVSPAISSLLEVVPDQGHSDLKMFIILPTWPDTFTVGHCDLWRSRCLTADAMLAVAILRPHSLHFRRGLRPSPRRHTSPHAVPTQSLSFAAGHKLSDLKTFGLASSGRLRPLFPWIRWSHNLTKS